MILCFKTRIFPALLIVLLTIINIELAYAERIYLDISAPDVRKLVVAIPAFKDQGSGSADTVTGREMAALLGRALDFHGFVKVADPKVYGSATTAEWKKYGVDFVVRGHFIKRGTELIIEGRLEDVDNRVLSGKRYKGQVVQRDDMVLRLADGLVKEFTGVPGISRTRIAYTSDKNGAKDIFISDVLGRSHRQVTRHRFLCVSPRFTEDGNFLAYTTYHRGNQDLYITDLRQDKVTRSLSRRKGMNLAPDFSPDGKSLVFVSDRSGQPQLYTMNMKTRAVQRLTFEGRENSEPSWSPKGDLIAYTGMVDGRYHIFTIKPGGGRSVRLTSAWGDYESPDWSPDGKQLAFSRQRNGHSEILTMFANGKGMRVLFPLEGNQTSPRWSPPSDDS